MSVETIEGEVVAVAKEVVGEAEAVVKAAEIKAVEYTKEARVEISTEEKFLISKLENEFLRAQGEIQRLTVVTQNAQKQFPQIIEGLVKKYLINPATHVFDNVELVFKQK
jgi:hypothetical protein